MGIYGFFNGNYNLDIDGWTNNSNHCFITVGTFLIPFIGGAGFGWKHHFSPSRISLFTSTSGFGVYMLPAMCSTNNCHTKYDFLVSGALGLDIYVIKTKRINLHLQLGILSQYSLGGIAIDESPSNIPAIWPVINIKFGD